MNSSIQKFAWFACRIGILAQTLASLLWVFLMPRGFPVDHPRFWTNIVIPSSTFLLGLFALLLVAIRPTRFVPLTARVMFFAWLALLLSWSIVFPQSWLRPTLIGAAPTFAWFLMALALSSRRMSVYLWSLAVAIVPSALVALWVCFQRAPLPDTRPAREAVTFAMERTDRSWEVGIDSVTKLRREYAAITLDLGKQDITIYPLLHFISRSPDRSWTIAARARARRGTRLQAVGLEHAESLWRAVYRGDESAELIIRSTNETSPLEIDATTSLPRDVYSHLNTYCEISLDGFAKPRLAFQGMDEEKFDVLPSDYPVGRPARLAYLDPNDEILRIVEATSGEKGPFRELARREIDSDGALTIGIYDGEQWQAEIVLRDWSLQAGRQLSPTAGWGLPVNAIEFSDRSIWITLAGTSVGRGWDSVGHKRGAYRNRMTVHRPGSSFEPIPNGGQQ